MALDGTKIEANATLDSNRTYDHIENEVRRMLTEAETKDAEEDKMYGKDKRCDELLKELQGYRSSISRCRVLQ